jgi:hypothetical protein
LLDQISQVEPDLPYKLLGHAAQNWIPNGKLAKGFLGGEMGATGIAAALAAALGNPHAALGMGATMLGEILAGSPHLMVGANRQLGKIQKKVSDVVPQGVKDVTSAVVNSATDFAAPYAKGAGNMASKYATPAAVGAGEFGQQEDQINSNPEDENNLKPIPKQPTPPVPPGFDPTTGQSLDEPSIDHNSLPSGYDKNGQLIDENQPPPEPHFAGGRVGRATGGGVHNAGRHEYLVNRLLNAAKDAKKITDKRTEPLLNVPDAHIVKALDVAQQSI